MRRTVVAVIAGYFVMVALIFVLFAMVWFALGADALFAPGRYDASTAWIAQSLLVAFVAALAAGSLAGRMGGRGAVRALAIVIVAIGILMAWPVLAAWTDARPDVRPAAISMMDATRYARQPPVVAGLLPFVGALGAWLGGSGFGRRRR
jgi:hypothetical protein